MHDEDSNKITTSALMGLVAFLASHIFIRLSKKGDDQDHLSADTRVLEARVSRLEEDLREVKKDLASHLRERGHHDD